MDSMEHEEDIDEDDVAAGEALTGPLNDAFSGLQGMLTSTRISNQDFFVPKVKRNLFATSCYVEIFMKIYQPNYF